ncbi:hypothetical protein AB4560_09710 [Vibrio sp. 10N.222.51.C12]|uniref:hypothetical protein n=1 Tax=Vibrio sp. 10N.222.51.C12 TaxID=3229622 RepID=UPI00354AF984
MAIKGTREWEKGKTQKEFLNAIERLISGKVKNKKALKTFKVNDSNVCKESGFKNGALKHYPRVSLFIKLKSKVPEAKWTETGDFELPDGGIICVSTVVETVSSKGTTSKGSKQKKAEKKEELEEINKAHVDAANAALERQVAVSEPFYAALLEALPEAKKHELIEKYEKVLHRRDYGEDVIHAVFGANRPKAVK